MQGGMEAALSVGLGVGSTLCTTGLVAPRLRRGWLCRARAPATYTRKRDTVPSGVGGVVISVPLAEESSLLPPPADLIEQFGTKAHMVDGMAVAVQPLR